MENNSVIFPKKENVLTVFWIHEEEIQIVYQILKNYLSKVSLKRNIVWHIAYLEKTSETWKKSSSQTIMLSHFDKKSLNKTLRYLGN